MAGRRFTHETELTIVRVYEDGGSLSMLARQHGCCIETIRKVLKRHGVARRPRGNTYLELSQSQLAELAARWQAGESQHAIAVSLGVSQVVVSRLMRRAGYTKETRHARGARHGRWVGGRVSTTTGYISIHLAPDDPLAPFQNQQGYMLEHRYVMAQRLGRGLLASETVHHINGDRADNRLENLQLRQGLHGAGVVLTCMDCGSHNITEAPLAEVASMT